MNPVEAACQCDSTDARPIASGIGTDLLQMTPEELPLAEGNMAYLLLAQTVCYLNSQQPLAEVLQRQDTPAKLQAALKACPAATTRRR